MKNTLWTLMLVATLSCAAGHPQQGHLAPNAPADRPVGISGATPAEAEAKFRAMIAPYVEQGRATYPNAKQRYLAGLAPGETFFVTIVLRDAEHHFEQVFVLVDGIEGGMIAGRISSQLMTVRGYRDGGFVRVSEAEVLDWVISKPDGSEDGNFVGKYLDTLSEGAH
jgi:hypothetical protein